MIFAQYNHLKMSFYHSKFYPIVISGIWAWPEFICHIRDVDSLYFLGNNVMYEYLVGYQMDRVFHLEYVGD